MRKVTGAGEGKQSDWWSHTGFKNEVIWSELMEEVFLKRSSVNY